MAKPYVEQTQWTKVSLSDFEGRWDLWFSKSRALGCSRVFKFWRALISVMTGAKTVLIRLRGVCLNSMHRYMCFLFPATGVWMHVHACACVCSDRYWSEEMSRRHTQKQVKRRGCRSGHSGNLSPVLWTQNGSGNDITLATGQRETASCSAHCLHGIQCLCGQHCSYGFTRIKPFLARMQNRSTGTCLDFKREGKILA